MRFTSTLSHRFYITSFFRKYFIYPVDPHGSDAVIEPSDHMTNWEQSEEDNISKFENNDPENYYLVRTKVLFGMRELCSKMSGEEDITLSLISQR